MKNNRPNKDIYIQREREGEQKEKKKNHEYLMRL